MAEFPVLFENPLFGIIGAVLAVTFTVLLYLSHKRLRIAEKSLELVRWQTARKAINTLNIGAKIGLIVMISFLLTTPYFPTTLEVPIGDLTQEQMSQNSVSVMLLMDVSYSMNNSDLAPSRLRVASEMARVFVENMSSKDAIGFMSFAGKVYDVELPTLNKTSIVEFIWNQTVQPSTAIGTALESALGMLEPFEGGKAIVLFSDGKNNVGVMNLTSVAEGAVAMKIPIFTVFVGTYGIGDADPIGLQDISRQTGGKFFDVKSEDTNSLVSEVSVISQEVKVGTLKAAFGTFSVEARDYHTPLLLFAALLVLCLFLTWLTGV
jgi:hypothetical protein